MRVLVTGGAGFLGSHLCRTLLARGDEVVAVDDYVDGEGYVLLTNEGGELELVGVGAGSGEFVGLFFVCVLKA